MADKYEKRGQIVKFEAGDYCIIKISKKDRSNSTTSIRIFARVLQRHDYLYKLQTKYGILQSKYSA
jgi:hypothetical protein